MLLSSLSILIGAILVPKHYFWLYSTHIILMCLYLIATKRSTTLCLTFLSLVSVTFNEYQSELPLSFTVDSTVFFDAETRTLFAQYDGEACSKRHCSVRVVYFTIEGVRKTLHRVSFSSSAAPPERALQARVSGITLAHKHGPWWERTLYIQREAAQFDLHFSDVDSHFLETKNTSLKKHVINTLDAKFGVFSSWRFSKALLLGLNDLWSERDTWVIRTLGLAHLFVVSGLHTGFMFVIGRVFSGIVWQLSPNRVMLSGVTRWHFDALIIIPLLFAYAYLTNWGEPVVRAAVMLSVYLGTRMLALKISPYSIITFALWLVLLIAPRSVLSPGLWLSFCMVYLLVGFFRSSLGISRLLMMQVMLSTASMVLILGWQEAISAVSILVNITLIPFAAFIWFPLGLMSCFEALLFGSTYLYFILEFLLNYLIIAVEWVAFTVPLLAFQSFSSGIPRMLMLCLICYWVYQSPLKRGWLVAIAIWCVLFSSNIFYDPEKLFSIINKDNRLTLVAKDNVQLSSDWAGKDLNALDFSSYLESNENGRYIIAPKDLSQLSPDKLLDYDINWVILKKAPMDNLKALFMALGVDWLVLSTNETLMFHFQNDQILLRHSTCIYSFFLFKSDTCKRVEKLESVLNYREN